MPKTILITGASSGIGLANVRYFLDKGYRVFATARKEADLAMLKALGAQAIFLDLNQADSIKACVAVVKEAANHTLDVLLNNAAYALPGTVEDLDLVALRAQFETNVFATLDITQQCLPMLRNAPMPRIVFISSMLSYCTMPMRSAYCASKYALTSFIAGLRMELMNTPVKIISIRPGPIDTQFRARAHSEFDAHVDGRKTHYKQQYDRLRAEGESAKKIPFCKPPSCVAALIYKAVSSNRPRRHYQVTVPAHIFLWVARLLPECVMDWLMTRI
jgi:short-subunit dehydrogenase